MGRALPNRINWVLTRDQSWQMDGVKVARSLEQILDQACNDVKQQNQEALFIIGGAEIFKQTMDIADRLELTHVDLNVQGDTFYPTIPDSFTATARHPMQDEKTGTKFEFVTYIRK